MSQVTDLNRLAVFLAARSRRVIRRLAAVAVFAFTNEINAIHADHDELGKRESAVMASGDHPVEICEGRTRCKGRNPLVTSIRVLEQNGARPRWSPDGHEIVFDRLRADGYNDVYVVTLNTGAVRTLTSGRPGIGQRHNGNADFDPTGKFVVFQSEEDNHMNMRAKWQAEPGIGLFSNLYATTPRGDRFWKLTAIPIKHSILDRTTPAIGVVNPVFSRDGSTLAWTERYDRGPKGSWGLWRVKAADWVVDSGTPSLRNVRVLAIPGKGNYMTAMGWLDAWTLLVAGNLDGQMEYAMDEYAYDTRDGRWSNLTNTPKFWEEGAAVRSDGRMIAYMTNATSRFPLDFADRKWHRQPTEREYWLMTANGDDKTRLTYFNDPSAPEYLGGRTIVAACKFSPDGRYLAGTLGIDVGAGGKADYQLKVVLIEFSGR